MSASKSDTLLFVQSLVWMLLALVFYSLLRTEFLLWNWSLWYRTLSGGEILKGFIHGLRFDLSILTWLSLPVFFGALLPWPQISSINKEKILATLFFLIHLPFLIFNMIDTDFIHFSGRRMTTNSFYLLKETGGKIAALWATHGFLILINGALLYLFYWGTQRLRFRQFSPHSPLAPDARPLRRQAILGLLLLLLLLGARGGWQPKPLELAHATAISGDFRITHLILNSSFTAVHSFQKQELKPLDYFAQGEAWTLLLNANTPGEPVWPWHQRPRNVVLFILESFGTEYTGLDAGLQSSHPKTSYTPFLDSLAKNSLVFTQSFANGRRSIESLPSLLAGIPSLMDEPFLTSSFQTNEVLPLGTELAAKGVWSGFFHGGANGTMFFQEFTQRLKFTKYFGKSEYPDSGDDDGTWGIWDGPFLNFFGKTLSSIHDPFFAVFFSLSSHHPFKVPAAYEHRLPRGPLPILQTIAYTDSMLKDFFEKNSSASWFKQTLFIFTADHTSKSYRPEYQTPLGSFRVPILLYFPGSHLSQEAPRLDLQEPVQHIDLLPTLQDIFLTQTKHSPLSRSLFKTGPRKVSLYLDGQQILVTRDTHLIRPTRGQDSESAHPLLPSWKAHRQQFVNGLLENTFFSDLD